MQEAFVSKHWGDLSSVLGVALTIVALFMAKGARDAAREVRNRISNLDTVGELASAVAILQEIARLQRGHVLEPVAWHMVLERYGALQLHLIRSSKGAALTHPHRNTITVALGQFRIIVDEIESARTDEERRRLSTSRFNQLISKQVEMVRIAVVLDEG